MTRSHLPYLAEKLSTAVELMATSPLPMRNRLELARLEFNPARMFDGYPDDVCTRLTHLCVRLETVEHLSDAECTRLARELFDLAFDVERLYRAHHLAAVQP